MDFTASASGCRSCSSRRVSAGCPGALGFVRRHAGGDQPDRRGHADHDRRPARHRRVGPVDVQLRASSSTTPASGRTCDTTAAVIAATGPRPLAAPDQHADGADPAVPAGARRGARVDSAAATAEPGQDERLHRRTRRARAGSSNSSARSTCSGRRGSPRSTCCCSCRSSAAWSLGSACTPARSSAGRCQPRATSPACPSRDGSKPPPRRGNTRWPPARRWAALADRPARGSRRRGHALGREGLQPRDRQPAVPRRAALLAGADRGRPALELPGLADRGAGDGLLQHRGRLRLVETGTAGRRGQGPARAVLHRLARQLQRHRTPPAASRRSSAPRSPTATPRRRPSRNTRRSPSTTRCDCRATAST